MYHNKKGIYDFIKCLIAEEKGNAIDLDDKVMASELDSLGLLFVLLGLDDKYSVLNGIDSGKEYEQLNLYSLTLRELVDLCDKSSATGQLSNEPRS